MKSKLDFINVKTGLFCSLDDCTASWALKILQRAVADAHTHQLIRGSFEESFVGICV